MKKTSVTTPVKGGFVKRDLKNGRFMEVRTADARVSKSTPASKVVLDAVSARRRAALKRLADR